MLEIDPDTTTTAHTASLIAPSKVAPNSPHKLVSIWRNKFLWTHRAQMELEEKTRAILLNQGAHWGIEVIRLIHNYNRGTLQQSGGNRYRIAHLRAEQIRRGMEDSGLDPRSVSSGVGLSAACLMERYIQENPQLFEELRHIDAIKLLRPDRNARISAVIKDFCDRMATITENNPNIGQEMASVLNTDFVTNAESRNYALTDWLEDSNPAHLSHHNRSAPTP